MTRVFFVIVCVLLTNLCLAQDNALSNLLKPANPYANLTETPDSFLLSVRMIEMGDIEDTKLFPDAFYPNKDYHSKILNKSAELITPKMLPVNIYDAPGMHVHKEGDIDSYNEGLAVLYKSESRFKFRYYLTSKFTSEQHEISVDTTVVDTYEVGLGKDGASKAVLNEMKVEAKYPFSFHIEIRQMGTDEVLLEKTFSNEAEWKNNFIPYEGKIKDLPKEYRKLARQNRKSPNYKNIATKTYYGLVNQAVQEIATFLSSNFQVPDIVSPTNSTAPISSTPPVSKNNIQTPEQGISTAGKKPLPGFIAQLEDRTPATELLQTFQSDLSFAKEKKGYVSIPGENYKLWTWKKQAQKLELGTSIEPDVFRTVICQQCTGKCSTCPASSYNGTMYWGERTKQAVDDPTKLISDTDYNNVLAINKSYHLLGRWEKVTYSVGKTKILDHAESTINGKKVHLVISRASYMVNGYDRSEFDSSWIGKEATRDFLHVVFDLGETFVEVIQPVGANQKVHSSIWDRQGIISDYSSGTANIKTFVKNYIEIIN